MTKKTSHSPKAKKESAPLRKHEPIAPLEDETILETPIEDTEIAADQFAVAARGDEASSSGHRVEPIQDDDEHNAEKLIEEGLHGYVRASPNHTHRGK